MILFLAVATAMAQGKSIRGVVLDAANHEPVIGASVLVKGVSGQGASTDINGKFTLKNVKAGAVLVVSSIGYKKIEVPVGNQTDLKIDLPTEDNQVEAVVVTALGIKRSQKALSYNVQEVKSDALTTVKDANFMNSLNGKVAGVNINASSSGLGGATRVVMRGPKSMNQSNQALYVIDGIPISILMEVKRMDVIPHSLRVKGSRISTLMILSRLASSVVLLQQLSMGQVLLRGSS